MWRHATAHQAHCPLHSERCQSLPRPALQIAELLSAQPCPHRTVHRRHQAAAFSAAAPVGTVPARKQVYSRSTACRASEDNSESGSKTSEDSASQDSRIKQTLAGLDALLGIVEEEKASTSDSKSEKGDKDKQDRTKIDVAPEIYKALAEAENLRRTNGKAGSPSDQAGVEKDVKSIIDAAQKLGESVQSPGMDKKEVQAVIKDEMEKLLDIMQPGLKQDLKKIKEEVFGPNVFWVTDMTSVSDKPLEIIPGSWMVRGNLRTARDDAFNKVVSGVEKLYGDKYTVFMMPDPEAELQDLQQAPRGNEAAPKERVAFVLSPSKYALPQEAPKWQLVVAAVLFLLGLGTAEQIGVAANIARFLPQNVIEMLARPDSFSAEAIAPELEQIDFVPLLLSSLPISSAIIILQGIQEIGHRFAANSRNVKLGTPILIPNGQIGLFGAVTQIKSLVRNRTDLFDISAAGAVGGGLASLALFLTGLGLSGSSAREDLLPVPAALLQGSLLLGGATQWALGSGAAAASAAGSAAASTIAVHPFVVGGWCGLVATALNCLPVGCLDGGRIMQAAFGRRSLGISSFFVYVALGLGLLGSSLALPFGLYVFICQRSPETCVQDTVSPPGSYRTAVALGIILTAILVLLPALSIADPSTPPDITL